MHCSNQSEKKFLQICKRHLSRKALQDVFVFTYDRMRRYEGAWHLEQQRMFPGYVFLGSGDAGQLTREMKEISYTKQILAESGPLIPLEQEEETFLRQLCGDKHHFGMSRGYIQDRRTFVTEGPLQGQEKLIRKIDRHKRIARVGIPEKGSGKDSGGTSSEKKLFSKVRELQVGLEIVEKN